MKLLLCLAFSLLVSESASGQTEPVNSPSVSIHTGLFFSSARYFDANYGSKSGFVYGGSVRLPVWRNVNGLARMSFLFKRNGGHEIRQWIANVGPEYRFDISDQFFARLSGGFASSVFLQSYPYVTTLGNTAGDVEFGAFAAIGLDLYLRDIPLTLFIDADLTYLPRKYITYTQDFGGAELVAGVRYHLPQ